MKTYKGKKKNKYKDLQATPTKCLHTLIISEKFPNVSIGGGLSKFIRKCKIVDILLI